MNARALGSRPQAGYSRLLPGSPARPLQRNTPLHHVPSKEGARDDLAMEFVAFVRSCRALTRGSTAQELQQGSLGG